MDEERDQGTDREEGRELLERVWRDADLDEEDARRLAVQGFRRLAALDNALAQLAFDRITMSYVALEAHRVEDTPHAPVEDPTQIKTLLGL